MLRGFKQLKAAQGEDRQMGESKASPGTADYASWNTMVAFRILGFLLPPPNSQDLVSSQDKNI